MKRLLAAAGTALLLVACSSTQESAMDVYGDANGGWNDSVNIMDLQPTALTKEFQKTGNDVIYFSFNGYSLDAQAKAELTAQADWLNANPRALIVIEGRCDERGTREYNLALGERRANAARSYLMTLGVAANRIRTISYGKDKPVVLGSDEEAWAKNRSATTVAY
ncbi:MAG: peptidoglycan-associated lipoprotein Pal [Alphaproteobacteria bacterium]|nr:peptidoglycan-associated lipoprotein Pal [Alphaproteobacteria bacterium]